ncbi:MAG: membrane protein insertase YidC, partial [Candidatus Eisenbacteria bacterium]
ETPLYHATFTSRGARLLAVELLKFGVHDPEHGRNKDAADQGASRVVLAGGPTFALDLGSGSAVQSLADVAYAVEESTDAAGDVRRLTFTAGDSAGFRVRQTWRARPDDYALDLEVEIQGVPDRLRVTEYTLSTRSWPLVTESNQQADETALKASSLVGTNIHREHPGSLNRGPKTYDGDARWAAVQSRYFLAGVAVLSGESRGVAASTSKRALSAAELARLAPNTRPEQNVLTSGLIVTLPRRDVPVNRFLVYFGPSDYFRLSGLKVQFERIVDMGWSWILPFSKALLQLLNWLFAVVRNYGVAIIALATLVRVVLHPLNLISMRSMREMQKLQPEMERIRDKYKSDPQALNAATMALYKEHKVNPAAGCLPMMLQMPLFLALYQVLFNAIELRQAPFVAWMQDLSAPDLAFSVAGFPIRILPLLMAGSGLLQQMVTPTDPRQRTTMYMMNVVMLVFFYSLPSGLVLYWTVMNLLTALQQWMVLRQGGGPAVLIPAPVPVKASGRRR